MGSGDAIEKRIIPREVTFDFAEAGSAWLNNDIYLSHMFNAASIILPYVEGFVVISARYYLPKLNDQHLHDLCSAFISQEVNHSREHYKYNLVIKKNSQTVDSIVRAIKNKLLLLRAKCSPLTALAFAVGFECFTSIVCKVVLERKMFANSNNDIAKFWQWHMREEIEHQAVLMDMYIQMGGGYFRRITLFAVVVAAYCYYASLIYFKLMRRDKLAVMKGLFCVFRKNPFYLKSLLRSFVCFRYRYHPGDAI